MPNCHAAAVSRLTGLISSIRAARPTNPFTDDTHLLFGRSAQLDELFPALEFRAPGEDGMFVVGSGCAAQFDLALRKAVFETLERYAAAVYATRDVIVASAEELGVDAFDWTRLGTLHVRAPGSDKWVAKPFDPRLPIRWVKGFHAVELRSVYVPLVMVHIHVVAGAGEDFHPQTTTGTAAHTSLDDATVAALCEAVERDAVETIWMTRAPLRRLEPDGPLPAGFAALHEKDRANSGFVDQRYFDATLEVGLPAVYSVRKIAPPLGHDVIVSCACHPDAGVALYKARLEASSQQQMRLSESTGVPYSRYRNEPGYLVKDHQAARPDLTFLDAGSQPSVSLSALRARTAHLAPASAAYAVAAVARRHKEIVIVDMATDELRELGVYVVKAIVPSLMPSSPSKEQAFPRHPRLAEVAELFKLSPSTVDRPNLQPQPFC